MSSENHGFGLHPFNYYGRATLIVEIKKFHYQLFHFPSGGGRCGFQTADFMCEDKT